MKRRPHRLDRVLLANRHCMNCAEAMASRATRSVSLRPAIGKNLLAVGGASSRDSGGCTKTDTRLSEIGRQVSEIGQPLSGIGHSTVRKRTGPNEGPARCANQQLDHAVARAIPPLRGDEIASESNGREKTIDWRRFSLERHATSSVYSAAKSRP